MQTNHQTNIGDIRRFIQHSHNRLPGQIFFDGTPLSDDTLLLNKDIFHTSHAVIEYHASDVLSFNCSVSFIKTDGDKISTSIYPKIYIGVTICFDEMAFYIKSSMISSDIEIDHQAPILFVFLNCRNDFVLIRDYPFGCSSFRLDQNINIAAKHVKTMNEPGARGLLSHDLHDSVMLFDVYHLKLSRRDSLVWYPNKPSI